MSLDQVFKALADPTRRRVLEELDERDGQTLFELQVRLISWNAAGMSRQALSKHLALLEEADLIRTEWEWRSKHHFLNRKPLKQLGEVWLAPMIGEHAAGERHENRSDEHLGG